MRGTGTDAAPPPPPHSLGNPYPTRTDKLDLVAATGLPLAKLETWFINMRRRSFKTTTAATPPSRV
ncbi:hypothetical protein AMAG_20076 [Allomyces macrogynus ATCC 38327]|uniref:Homeobox domain-containing protein n=1 Tax=Allomyces macrogynus (strain ATCC 38327) TaxID=578462 RepID=A0A0L0T6H4_ALLM3|nr:hypothetical protein AMAG_20076 [Allomyces macrogynus ATCC 38327]|eukprot:KNE70286.1 hypothetical protein AMAG_20076 [Allomyces macrogynus ATCC 38327]